MNECLYEGPSLFPEILGVLIRFRFFQYAFITDIEKAFLQIGVAECDRNFMRFLWYDGDVSNNDWPKGKVISFRFCRVPFGFRASPYLLNQTVRSHLSQHKQSFPDTVEAISKNVYVDDIIVSADCANKLQVISEETKKVFSLMSMSLHKCNSNVKGICQNECEKTSSVLGLLWNSYTDTLCLKSYKTESIQTKRQIASVLCGFFDPLRWYIPFTNKLKFLLHECWKAKLTWDDPLPLEIQEKTESISQDMSKVANNQINRWIKCTSNSSSIELHGYGDASSIVYSTCVYLVFQRAIQQFQILCVPSLV